jgi:hypothetical protein
MLEVPPADVLLEGTDWARGWHDRHRINGGAVCWRPTGRITLPRG